MIEKIVRVMRQITPVILIAWSNLSQRDDRDLAIFGYLTVNPVFLYQGMDFAK